MKTGNGFPIVYIPTPPRVLVRGETAARLRGRLSDLGIGLAELHIARARLHVRLADLHVAASDRPAGNHAGAEGNI